MSIFVSKECINRLLHDVREIINNPLDSHGIYYVHDDTDMLKGYAMIVGPQDTPYFGGYYLFELFYPPEYPHKPPKVLFSTNADNVRFNPNLYVNGKVCISLLNTWRGEQWTSCQTITTILLTLCTILNENPLMNEPGLYIHHPDIINYNEIIQYSNFEIAIYYLLTKNSNIYLPYFDYFYNIMREIFINNYDKYLSIIENKMNIYDKPKLISVGIYSLSRKIDYVRISELLNEAKLYIENC